MKCEHKYADKFMSGIAIAILLMTCIPMAGCGKKGVAKVASDTKVFAAASPEIKADWEKAVAAAAARDYATAILTCRKMQLQGGMTPQQLAAVVDTITVVNNQLLDALQKGDSNAATAMDAVRKNWRQPR